MPDPDCLDPPEEPITKHSNSILRTHTAKLLKPKRHSMLVALEIGYGVDEKSRS